jgi:hypothetical protein
MQVRWPRALGGGLCKADILRMFLVSLFAQGGKIKQVQSGRTGLQRNGALQALQVARVLHGVYDPT